MADTCQIVRLVDLGFGVFEEVVETSIFVNKRSSKRSTHETFLATGASTSEQINDLPFTIPSERIIEEADFRQDLSPTSR